MSRPHWFTRGFGAAVADVRSKLVEEAWFGRTVTPASFGQPGTDKNERPLTEQLGWERAPDAEAGRATPHAPDQGIDH